MLEGSVGDLGIMDPDQARTEDRNSGLSFSLMATY